MIVALIALCMALGGTGYAATSLQAPTGPTTLSAAKRHSPQRGPRGKRGKTGKRGKAGPAGPNGLIGQAGPTGAIGPHGATGDSGATGSAGATGATGPIGPSQYAEFFALMPPDNAATVAAGTAVGFPQDGPQSGAISRNSASTFVLPDIGTYRVAFSVPVTEPGQLGLTLNSSPLSYTVYGRATGTTSIAGEALVTTTIINSLVSVVNPVGNPTALTITPLAGGTHPAVASLVIERLN